jgi:hypothetical protein
MHRRDERMSQIPDHLPAHVSVAVNSSAPMTDD